MTVELADIHAARDRIHGRVRETPVFGSARLSLLSGHPVWFKCEQFQRTGSFKARGAANVVAGLDEAQKARGLVVASAGNHAQGVATAGRDAGVEVTVVMPVTAPLAKVNASTGYGATVVLEGANLEQARQKAEEIAETTGRLYIPPFDDDRVIAGQGTIGLEILEQVPSVEEIVVPAGGGGLLAGVAVAVKSLRPEVRIVGVQSMAMDGICRSFRSGGVVLTPASRTIADGAAVAGPSERTFELIRKYVDEMVSVPEEAIASAIVTLIERSKMVVEGAGALAVAALESGACRPSGPAVAILSGGNIDINLLGSIVRHGLVVDGRYRSLGIEVSDTPGELGLVSRAIGEAGGNILEVDHNRDAPGMPVGVALLELLIEVNGAEHFDAILERLRESGLRGVPGSPARLATEGARQLHDH